LSGVLKQGQLTAKDYQNRRLPASESIFLSSIMPMTISINGRFLQEIVENGLGPATVYG
jgi:hypothetical protein